MRDILLSENLLDMFHGRNVILTTLKKVSKIVKLRLQTCVDLESKYFRGLLDKLFIKHFYIAYSRTIHIFD